MYSNAFRGQSPGGIVTRSTEYGVRYTTKRGREIILGPWSDKSIARIFAAKLLLQGCEPRVVVRPLGSWTDMSQ
jgi:hypothetical protein